MKYCGQPFFFFRTNRFCFYESKWMPSKFFVKKKSSQAYVLKSY